MMVEEWRGGAALNKNCGETRNDMYGVQGKVG
jgi:hypothetical protein